jgi:NDP-sugar pyrophosphorylase family protein
LNDEGPIVGILLAAGRGDRLRPLTDSIAKPALLVGDKPLGAYGLEMLKELDGRLAVNLSWLAGPSREALEPFAPPGTRWLIESPEPYGTAGTVAALLPELAPTFVVANADTITDLSVYELLKAHARLGTSATVAVRRVEEGADLEARSGKAVRFIDRRSDPSAPGYLYIGVAALDRDRVHPLLEPGRVAGLAESVFRVLVERGELGIHEHEGFTIDVGTHDRLEQARRRYASNRP